MVSRLAVLNLAGWAHSRSGIVAWPARRPRPTPAARRKAARRDSSARVPPSAFELLRISDVVLCRAMDAASNHPLHARAPAEYEQGRFSGRRLRDGDAMVARLAVLNSCRLGAQPIGQSRRGRRVGQADACRQAKSGRRDSSRACSSQRVRVVASQRCRFVPRNGCRIESAATRAGRGSVRARPLFRPPPPRRRRHGCPIGCSESWLFGGSSKR